MVLALTCLHGVQTFRVSSPSRRNMHKYQSSSRSLLKASIAEPPSESSKPQIPKVGGSMPSGRRPDWFHVPAPGGSHTRFQELQVSKPSSYPFCIHTPHLPMHHFDDYF